MTRETEWCAGICELEEAFGPESVITVTGPVLRSGGPYDRFEPGTHPLLGILLRSTLAVSTFPTVVTDGEAVPTTLRARLAPTSAADALIYAGIRAVNVATAHALDGGADGLRQTMAALRRRGIACLGAGDAVESIRRPHIQMTPAGPVALLGVRCAETLMHGRENDSGKPASALCTVPVHAVRPDSSGKAERLPAADAMRDLQAMVAQAKRVARATIVLVDTAYAEETTPDWIREIARSIVSSGANVVCVSGTHGIRAFEGFEGGLIFHGLGDFFHEPWTEGPWPGEVVPESRGAGPREGLVLRLVLGEKGLRVAQLIPYELSETGHPRLPGAGRAAAVLDGLRAMSGTSAGQLAPNGSLATVRM